jgi:hypothetical protein
VVEEVERLAPELQVYRFCDVYVLLQPQLEA